MIIDSDDEGDPRAKLSRIGSGTYEGNEVTMSCKNFDLDECNGQLAFSTLLSTFDDPHDNDECGYDKDGFAQTVTPCAEEIDADLECVELKGEFITIRPIEVTANTGCTFKFVSDIGDCHSNRDEFLRLMWYDEKTSCFSFDGISDNTGNVDNPRSSILEANFAHANHLT